MIAEHPLLEASPGDPFSSGARTWTAPDGRSWELHTGPAAVSVERSGGTLARALIQELQEQVVIAFWTDGADLPDALTEELVELAFSRPAVVPGRQVQVCVPRRHGAVLDKAAERVANARTRAAGSTALIEGQVRSHIPVPRSGANVAMPYHPGTMDPLGPF